MKKLKNNIVKIGAVGDIFLCREIQTICEKEGYDYPFRQVAHVLKSYDIMFGNLENPISDRGIAAKKNLHITFRAKPESVNALKYAGFNIVSLANNHMNDYGREALIDTLSILDDNRIVYVGAGENEAQARQHVVIQKNNTKVSFLAYHHLLGKASIPAIEEKPGIAHLDKKKCLMEIKKARVQSDVVIVSIHWGIDYCDYPSPYYIELARDFIDSGCDMIIGHHSHVLQGYEKYKDGYIFYGLGNFIFDDPNPKTKFAVILDITIENRRIADYQFLPVYDDGTHQAQLADGEIKEKILARIENFSMKYKQGDWRGNFFKDPTDDLIWRSFKSIRNGGSIYHLKNLPVSTLLKRIFPLLFFKMRQHLPKGIIGKL